MVYQIKIQGIRPTRPVSSLKKKKDIKDKIFKKEVDTLSKNEMKHSDLEDINSTAGISNSLYTLQEQDTNLADEKKEKEYGKDLLDLLSSYRHKIILGDANISELKKIKDSILLFKMQSKNKELNEIIDEIELRAKIELAKCGVE